MQALVQLLLLQRARDRARGRNTAGFVSGYRGSPLGALDQQLERQREALAAARIHVEPGVNEDLAATAILGTQQATQLPGTDVDGVFAMWYGKGPGVDRSGDAIRHGNRFGSAPLGGVLLVFGDDHTGKSSTTAHQSEQALATHGVPVLYPATIQEYVELGLHGFALSRFSGAWVGLKCVNETAEGTCTVDLALQGIDAEIGDDDSQWPRRPQAPLKFDPLGDDVRLSRTTIPRVLEYTRCRGLDRVTYGSQAAGGLGIVTAGKSWLDVKQALQALGLTESRMTALGVSVYKPALIWPLEPSGLLAFAADRDELLVVEDKAAFIESQAAHVLYTSATSHRPRLVGKRCERGDPLFPSDVPLEPLEIARTIVDRLRRLHRTDAELERQRAALDAALARADAHERAPYRRAPYFCSGCPHSTSTRIPDGSLAMAGIGCHTIASFVDPNTVPPVQMGGEGANWIGIAPFTRTRHVFQNLGDGTYFHSGLLAIRAAVTAGVNITYKILVNDTVAMTGGQRVEGGLSAAEIAKQLRAERIRRIAVVTDDPSKHARRSFPPETTIHARSALDAVQRELQSTPGVSALIYEQVCAAEKRRRRKRQKAPSATPRAIINELVCEGCGDCNAASRCASVEPKETVLGRKRQIDQSSCNTDYSCIDGFCPSFVSVRGATVRKPSPEAVSPALFASLPAPTRAALDPNRAWSAVIAGIGGTGVVTVGAILAQAALIESRAVFVYDMTGLAQKGGAVLSHVRIAATDAPIGAPKVGIGEADLILGCDLVSTASSDVLRSINPGRTQAVLNMRVAPTSAVQFDRDFDFQPNALLTLLERSVGDDACHRFDAHVAAVTLVGDSLGTNMMMVGYALQKGWLPVGLVAIEGAIRRNGVAVTFNLTALSLGRLAASNPAAIVGVIADRRPRRWWDADERDDVDAAAALDRSIRLREQYLTQYQDAAYAKRYRALVERVAECERRAALDSTALSIAVAKNYFKLLAYKDEYEVARLHSTTLREQLDATFDGDYRITFHLAPPLVARRDPQSGLPAKREYGAWMLTALGYLARLKCLRGTPFDPFGYTKERKMERQLIRRYETVIDEIVTRLDRDRYPTAVALATLPDRIRGFGHVKARSIAAAAIEEEALLARWRSRTDSGAIRQTAVTQ